MFKEKKRPLLEYYCTIIAHLRYSRRTLPKVKLFAKGLSFAKKWGDSHKLPDICKEGVAFWNCTRQMLVYVGNHKRKLTSESGEKVLEDKRGVNRGIKY